MKRESIFPFCGEKELSLPPILEIPSNLRAIWLLYSPVSTVQYGPHYYPCVTIEETCPESTVSGGG